MSLVISWLVLMKKIEWDFTEDPLTYLHSDPSYYVQYTQTIFSKPHAKLLNTKNGAYVTSIDQTQISEFEKNLKELREFGFEIADQLVEISGRCSKTGYTQKCECGKINFKPRYSKGLNHKRICPICNRSRAKSLGRTKFIRTYGVKPDYVAHLVLTLPRDHVKHCTRNEYIWLNDTHEYLFSKAKQFIAHFFEGYGFDAKVHSWHSQNPLTYPHWHIHCIIPLVKVSNGKIIQKNGHVFKENLEEMRSYWKALIGWETEVNINYSFAKMRDEDFTHKIRHWYSYISRGAICDINEWLLEHPDTKLSENRHRWFKFHTDPIKKHYKELRSFGSLAECNISKFLEDCDSSLQVVHEWIKQEIQESKKLFCCHCFAELDPRRWEYHEGFIPRANFAKSKEKWYRYLDSTSYLIDTKSLPG